MFYGRSKAPDPRASANEEAGQKSKLDVLWNSARILGLAENSPGKKASRGAKARRPRLESRPSLTSSSLFPPSCSASPTSSSPNSRWLLRARCPADECEWRGTDLLDVSILPCCWPLHVLRLVRPCGALECPSSYLFVPCPSIFVIVLPRQNGSLISHHRHLR